jgi:TRAP transporter TAXI family solute receptor
VAAERILGVAGLRDAVELSRLDVGASARALAARRIDAFFWSGGLPSAAITDLRRGTDMRLIDLGSTIEPLIREYGDLYTRTTVPASVYGLSNAVTTVSVPNFLVVRRDLPPATAYWLTRLLFEDQPRLAEVHPEARRLDPGSAIMTYPLELHEGAVRWYRSAHR